jgi:hypothetical protein
MHAEGFRKSCPGQVWLSSLMPIFMLLVIGRWFEWRSTQVVLTNSARKVTMVYRLEV